MIHLVNSTGTACGDRVHVLGSAHTTDDPAAVTCDCCMRRIRRWPCPIDGDECFRRHGPDSPCQHGMEPPADGTVACLHCGSSFRARLAEYVAAVETALMQTEVGRTAWPRYAELLRNAGDALKRECANAPDQARLQPSPEAGCSVCHAKLGHHDDPDPHHCLLQAGHEGLHFCHICGLYWDTPNAALTGGEAVPSNGVVGHSEL